LGTRPPAGPRDAATRAAPVQQTERRRRSSFPHRGRRGSGPPGGGTHTRGGPGPTAGGGLGQEGRRAGGTAGGAGRKGRRGGKTSVTLIRTLHRNVCLHVHPLRAMLGVMFTPKFPACAIHHGACLPICATPPSGLTRTGGTPAMLADGNRGARAAAAGT